MRRTFTRVISMILLIAPSVHGNAQPGDVNCKRFFQFNGDINDARNQLEANPEQLAWNWFVCLNRPAGTSSDIRVWETLKPIDQVYLPDGSKPLPYKKREPVPKQVLAKAKQLNMNPGRTFHKMNTVQQVDGLILEMGGSVPKPRQGEPVRYQLLMGQDTFNYILGKSVYNVNGQAALTEDLNFPPTAWELKTSWLWVGTDKDFLKALRNDGYQIVQAYFSGEDGEYQVGYAALSGMHVINRLTDNWVWTTFENRNNHKYTVTNDIPPTPMTNSTGPTEAARNVNKPFQDAYPDLRQYELIGVQHQAGGEPKLLASSQMESAFQSQSSCMACHGTAAYSEEKGHFNFARQEQGGIVYPTTSLPDSDFKGYHKLDFVWSLKRANWKRQGE